MDIEILFIALPALGMLAASLELVRSLFRLRREVVEKKQTQDWLARGPQAEKVERMLSDGKLDEHELDQLYVMIRNHAELVSTTSVAETLAELSESDKKRYLNSLIKLTKRSLRQPAI